MPDTTLVAVAVPLGSAFMLFVAPLWLWLHYRRGGANRAEIQRLEAGLTTLAATAQRLEQRVATLERALLDADRSYTATV
ncbi:envelope stress response membrane protein PspB [Acidiphilium sp.]|uniref:envelope stress response membrane protein PspB n=1 Tax=Acidiphilium sp. TaxID=527 RepID=UPI003D071EF1